MSRNLLSQNNELRKGDYLMSNNKAWKAIFQLQLFCFHLQEDGNFVIYGWKPVWASDTCGSDVARLIMQADCNLVMYNQCGTPRWHTNSWQQGSHVCRFHLTDDGKMLVYKDSGELWSSAKSKGMK